MFLALEKKVTSSVGAARSVLSEGHVAPTELETLELDLATNMTHLRRSTYDANGSQVQT
jgi:hypothetical protein